MTALTQPVARWWVPLGRDEKLWVTVALAWCLIMFAMMWVWPLVGNQNVPIESYRVDPAAFQRAYDQFVEEHQVGELNGVPVVRPEPGGEAYLLAMAFQFRPVLELKRGETYVLYVSSIDLQHGLSIQPVNLNFQVLPGYVYVVRLNPTETGEFSLVCNEYCGPGHHLMTGKIIVTD